MRSKTSGAISIFILAAIVFTLQSFLPNDASESKINEIKQKLFIANYLYPAETVYLQLDRPSYWANEDIWFKAYLQSEVDSSNIYVELIDPAGKVVQKKMYLAQDGLAYGDMHLPDTIQSGVYQLRSYTNWMRNFDENSFFHKNLIIWNLKDKIIANKSESIKRKDIDIQFFPEGGTFIAGIKNKLGFKAVDENGVGIDASGLITDDKNRQVCEFRSQFKGMGHIELTPEPGMQYYASIDFDGNLLKFQLPPSQMTGVQLAVNTQNPEDIEISITAQNETSVNSQAYILCGQTRGVSIFTKAIDLSGGTFKLEVSRNILPSGVLQLTLFDPDLNPRCERLVFINRNDYVQLKIKPNKETFEIREKVVIKTKSYSPDNEPKIANLSFTAFASDGNLNIEEYPNNILTHFLLTADLKGTIEEPAYYFKDESAETQSALDNLMLTQGWRRFSWQAVLRNMHPIIEYDHESSITIQGNVIGKYNDKPLPNSVVTLIFDEIAYKYYQQTTDSMGRFLFNNFHFFDETSILLKSERENGRKNTWLNIDDRSQTSPAIERLPLNYTMKNQQKVTTTYDISIKDSSLIKRKWHITDTILLNDIDIFGRYRKDNSIINEPIMRNGGIPNFTVKVDEEDEMEFSILDVVTRRIPGLSLMLSDGEEGLGFLGNSAPALIVLDGVPTEWQVVAALAISSIDKVEAMRIAIMYGTKGNNGALLFTTKRGVKNTEVLLPSGVDRIKVLGYSLIREFYSPKYENQKHSIEKTDFRSTLYWHPNIWTDEYGEASVTYYNSDQTGEVSIIMEGLTTDGRICRGTCTYKVIQ